MFERRLKIFLAILVGITTVLLLRAAYVQVVQKETWRAKAAESMTRSRSIETVRGSILDFRGRPIAVDRPCIDACVDFRALSRPADEKWVRAVAIERVRGRLRDAYKELSRSNRNAVIRDETQRVLADIDDMWRRLAEVAGVPLEDVEATRDQIVRKVTLRRRHVWYRNYQIAMRKYEQLPPTPAWRRWLIDETADAPTPEQFTDLVVAEELDDHPILKAITTEQQNALRKHIERYPGLVLRPGVERYYPYGDAGCHVIGQMSRVMREDLAADPNLASDELRQYQPSDLIGRSGLERLGEPILRGSRGRIETIDGREGELARVQPLPGGDLRTSIDIELQQDVTNMFRYATVPTKRGEAPEVVAMHGSAVLIDVPTGEVRVLVSFPTFDLNKYDEMYPQLAQDELNTPLLNRATQAQLVPGSTVKPMVGLGAITDGLVGVNEGIECTGHLIINGKHIRPGFRCWTESKFGETYPGLVAHHQIPSQDPHVGHDGNPSGYLTFSDALQRSCNVYFETLGDRLRIEGMSRWYYRFGLGRPTGIGIREVTGRLPISHLSMFNRPQIAWHSAIGQVQVTATPIQMANVAATIARGGVWVRPTLLREGQDAPNRSRRDTPTTHPASSLKAMLASLLPESERGLDRVDLHLKPEALAAARQGMVWVVNTTAGTGTQVHRDDIVVAAKTGTATASPLRIKLRDKAGNVLLDDKGKPMTELLRPSTHDDPNPIAPWYRGGGEDGKTSNHAWFIGFAPADNPKVAFAVLVEYGVSGGAAAGSVASGLLEACVERGYLKREKAGEKR